MSVRAAVRSRVAPALLTCVAVAATTVAALTPSSGVRGASYVVGTVDASGSPGWYTSMQLDAAGNPAISYQAAANDDLRVVRCDDPTCSGGGETIETPVTGGDVGYWTSLRLDAAGNPVVAYYNASSQRLAVLHCDDPACAPGGDTITVPDTSTEAGRFPSMQLDVAGNPVIAYRDDANTALKILHCDDPNCSPGGDSITTPDSAVNAGYYPSLQLDAAGHPVVSYHDETAGLLKILHCDDPNCDGTGDSVTTPDATNTAGRFTSLELDASGHPVVSYFAPGANTLRVLHCDDPNCDGTGDTIEQPDATIGVGAYTSLELDSSGNPVVSYFDYFRFDLRVVRCNDPACTGGDETIEQVDTAGTVGEWTALALDAADNPIVVYRSETDQSMLVAAYGDHGYPVPACVIAWWSGEDDLSARIGPPLTGPVGFADAVVGRGFALDSSSDLSIDGFPVLADGVSVEMWIRPDQLVQTQTLVTRWNFPSTDDAARSFDLVLSPTGRLWWSTDETSLRRPEQLAAEVPQVFDGAFHHIAATWDGTTSVLYFDGAEVASRPSYGGTLNAAATTAFRIGGRSGGGAPARMSGVIDEPTVYSCALDPTEVQAIFAAGADGKR